MKIGVQFVSFAWPEGPDGIANRVGEIARLADRSGLHSLWFEDHFFQVPAQGAADDPMLEAYVALGYLASETEHVQLGTLVTGNTYRNPALAIKMVTTLDVLSLGRAYLGLGTGWLKREHVGLGFRYPSLSERFARLEETLQIALHMWSGTLEPYHGEFHELKEPLCVPPPISKPHPRILVGGMGEQKTLRLVARYADASNFYLVDRGQGLAPLAPKLEKLAAYCSELGRDFDEIERTLLVGTLLGSGGETNDDVIELCADAARMGFQHLIFMLQPGFEIPLVEALAGGVISQVREL
jgi:F420-dependent oxidoreductase-like protein